LYKLKKLPQVRDSLSTSSVFKISVHSRSDPAKLTHIEQPILLRGSGIMATKAELEAELAELKAQLVANQATEKEQQPDEPQEPPADEWEDLGQGSFEGIAEQIVEELEEFSAKKPMLMALGIFVLGYMIGRSR
jgi:hypothetical protein